MAKKNKSIVKRILKWSGITFLLLLILIITLPFIFKDKLIAIAKEQVNNNVNAKIEWGDFSLSIFESFPDFTFHIDNVTVDGIGEFEGVRLAELKGTTIDLDLMSVINGEQYKINRIGIDNPTIHVIVTDSGVANYDIAKPSTDTNSVEETTAESSEEFKYDLLLKEFYVHNANIKYEDNFGNTFAELKNLNFDLSGDFTQDVFDIDTKTVIEELTVSQSGVKYFNKTNLDADAKVNIDQFTKYTMKDNNIKINELNLGFDGVFEMLEENYNIDMKFESKQTDFKNILSLVPAVYMSDFSNVQTKGQLALNGNANGQGDYAGNLLPAFNLNLNIKDGYFKYPDLPNSADNINVNTLISHPGGDMNNIKVDVSKFHLELAKNPIDATLHLSSLLTDPNFKTEVMAHIDLDNLKTVVPMEEGQELKGKIDADFKMSARQSYITNEQYDKVMAEGMLNIQDITSKSKDLPYEVNVQKLNMNMSPTVVEVSELKSTIGKSDFSGNGQVSNVLPYLLNGEDLRGTFNLNSNKLDLDELSMSSSEESTSTESTSEAMDTASYGVIKVPAGYDMQLQTSVNELIYDGLTIKNVKGGVIVKNQEALLQGVNMDLLGGNVTMSGSYNTQSKNPVVNFTYDVKSLDIAQTTTYLKSIEYMAPIAKYADGKFSTKMKFNSELDQNLYPIMSTVNGWGDLSSSDVTIAGFKPLEKISEVIKVKELANQKLQDIALSYELKDGRAIVKPFTTKLSGMKTQIQGSTGIDQTMDYKLTMEVPRARMGAEANKVVEGLLSKVQDKTGVEAKLGDIIPIDIFVEGTILDPKIKTNLKDQVSNSVNDIKDQVITTVKDTIQHFVNEGKEKVNEQIDKIMADAKAQAEKVRQEGYQAAENGKKAIYDQAAELENKGANFLEKKANKLAADKLRKEADDKYTKAKAETDKRAQSIIDAAQVKADKLKLEQ